MWVFLFGNWTRFKTWKFLQMCTHWDFWCICVLVGLWCKMLGAMSWPGFEIYAWHIFYKILKSLCHIYCWDLDFEVCKYIYKRCRIWSNNFHFLYQGPSKSQNVAFVEVVSCMWFAFSFLIQECFNWSNYSQKVMDVDKKKKLGWKMHLHVLIPHHKTLMYLS